MPWQDDVVRLREEMPDAKWWQIAEALSERYGEDLNPERVRSAYRKRNKPSPEQKGNITFQDKRKPPGEADVERFLEVMQEAQEASSALDTKQVTAEIDLDEDKPVGLCFWGDWHQGHSGVDYELFNEHRELIRSTKGLYIAGMGDYRENVITGGHAGAMFGQMFEPAIQDATVLHVMGQHDEQMLVLCRGCHDDWTFKMSGQDFIAACAHAAKAVNFWHGGTLTLKVGRETYTGHIRHKYKYESSLNTTNAMRRMMELYGPADFAALAHLHNPEVDERHLMGDYRFFIRSGAYKVWDEYGQKLGGLKGKPGVPVLILFPREHRMVAHRDLRTGIEHLKALRGGA